MHLPSYCFQASKVALFLLASSITQALLSAVLGAGIIIINTDWSFSAVLEAHYEEICGVFLNPIRNHSTATGADTHSTTCEITNITTTVTLIGASGCIADFASLLIENSILDIFLLWAFTIFQNASQLVDILPRHEESPASEDGSSANATEICFKTYDRLLKLSLQLDSGFGGFFKAMHIYNMLLTVYFTHEVFTGHKNGSFIILLIQVVKASLGYYYAVMTANKVRCCLKCFWNLN